MRKCVTAFIGAMALMPFLLTSCGSGSGSVTENRSNRGYNPGVGPFDSSGNYVERWADDKSKGRWWRKSSGSSSSTAVAKETPPTSTLPPVAAATITPQPLYTKPTPPLVRPPVGASRPYYTPKPTVAATPKPKPKPKPKPVAKTKPKSKPPITHTIKKGDTLYGLSRKYGASVSSIQRANGLKGTNLRIGKKLLIPRY